VFVENSGSGGDDVNMYTDACFALTLAATGRMRYLHYWVGTKKGSRWPDGKAQDYVSFLSRRTT
jgi:hypothetical protein